MFSIPRFRYSLVASIALLLPLQGQQISPTLLKHIFPSRSNATAATANQSTGGGIGQLSTAGNGIVYHGGPLMLGAPNVYYIWYGNWGSDPTGVTILQNFVQFEGGSPYYGVNTTYYDGSSTHISNSINFGPSYSDNYSRGKILGDADILAIVSAAITGGHLPSDPNGIYFVLTWEDVQETSGFITKYCGWHTRGTVGGVDIKYSFVGDAKTQGLSSCAAQTASSPNGDPAVDAMASVVAHELEESTSDPDLNAWYDSMGNENADKCAWTFGTTYSAINGSLANMNLGGYDYLIQQNWVNASGGYCALSLPNVPSLTASISPSSGAANSSVPVTIAGTHLSGGTINISGTGVSASNVSAGATQITATFVIAANATAGVRSVTVTTAGGTSNAETFTVIAAQVAAPTFSPPGGSYSSTQIVMISSTTGGASIRYTTDGSAPSETMGTLYNSLTPVAVSSSLTLKAIAYETGMTDSTVASAAYTITGGSGPPWYNPSWTNRKAITIDHTKVSGSSNLTSFPMLFSVTDANLKMVANGGVGKVDGTDILFTDASGTLKINHELESYNPVTGQVIAWVQVPSVSPTADTVIYIYYGNAAAADQQNRTGVWDSNFVGVWHLPNGAILNAGDSTGNANNGTIIGATATTGQIDGGMSTGAGKYVLSLAMPTASSVTWSAWVKSSSSGNYQMITSAVNANQYELRLDSSNHADLVWNYPGVGNYGEVRGTTAMTDGNWHYLVGTYDGASIRLYVDGSPVGSSAVAGFSTPFTSFEMGGRQGDPSYPFNGSLDEIRYSKTNRSSDWTLTEFRNQSAPSTFFTSGVQESSGGGGGQVAAPTFSPPGGSYSSTQIVMISSTTGGASIRYTTDGSAPSETMGTLYNSLTPVAVSSSLTLKAIAYETGMTDSTVASAAYTITGGSGPPWYNPSWTNRKAITIDHTKVSGSSNLTSFPMLFSVTDANLKMVANGVGKVDGTDILFTDASGTLKINHELESYNPVTGQVIAWVQVPSVSPTADTVIYIYYGNAAAADQQNRTGVWDSNFVGVWHLPNGAILNAGDSTGNANNGTIIGATATTGQIDGGMSTGAGKYVLSLAMPTASSVTWSAWVKSSSSGNYQMITSAVNANQYELRLDSSNHADLVWNYPGVGNYGEVRGTTAMTDGNWHYLVGTYDGASIRLYVDGSPVGSSAVAGFSTPFTSFEMGGRQGDPSYPFNGSLDEIRYSKTNRSSDWTLTEFRNQSAPSTFFTSGVQESSGGGGGQVAAPTFSPPGGSYSSTQIVMISSTTGGASIRYTTDGSAPSETMGTLYNSLTPVAVSSSLTLKAIAYETGMTDSTVASAAYTITGGSGPPWYNPSWTNRKAITIDHTKVSGSSNLTSFPMLFSVTDANLKMVANGVGKVDGTDILFTDASGTLKINHELESYNPVTGQVIAWVQVPSVSPTADTVIYIYYGNAAAADQQNRTGVWDSNFVGVWHLPNGTILNAGDSTGNANNGTIIGATATTGQIDGGMSTGAGKYVLSLAMPTASSVTWSAWVKSSSSGNYQMITSAVNANQYELRLDSSNHADLVWNYPGVGNYGEVRGTTAMTDGNWHYLVGTYDGASIRLYVDGSPVGSSAVAGFSTPFTSFEMGGRQGDPSYPFNGSLDEIRYSKTNRSSDWIATEYSNQNSPATFFIEGPQQ